jgi:hypothetical protein
MHTHHADDYAGAEAVGAASWMLAMFAVVIAAALVVALLFWAPWHSSSVTNPGSGGTQSGQQQSGQSGSSQSGHGSSNQPDVNVSGNHVNVGDNGGQSQGQ